MKMMMRTALAVTALAACGDDGTTVTVDAATAVDAAALDAASLDAAPVAFTLTSGTITQGGVIPSTHVCAMHGGANDSPALAWTGGPTAPGYALIFTDITNTSNPFLHSILWDIPGTATSLPANIAQVAEPPDPAGSKQPIGYDGQTRGYLGPCPGSMHTYEFALYAVDEYPLTGVTLQSNRTAVRTAILAHDTANAKLTATFTPP